MLLLAIFGFLIVIGPLIFVHELGHYLVGRWCGVKAEVFSIGMGRELTGWTDKRGTRWKLSALPIGGYVKFAGDMGPAGRKDLAWLRLPPEEKAVTFQAKALWQRFLIVLAGPLTNFIVAVVIYIGFFAAYGVPQTSTVIQTVLPHSAAEKAGLRAGDKITAIAGHGVESFLEVQDAVHIRPGQSMSVDVLRGGSPLTLMAFTQVQVVQDRLGRPANIGLLGVVPEQERVVRSGPVTVVRAALRYTFGAVQQTLDVLGQILTGQRSVKEMGGPIQIARLSGQTVSMGLLPVIDFMAMISINLGFMNLLPIPMLDGGHLIFYLIEGVSRRPLPERAQEWAFRSGLVLLLGFMAFVTINDLGSLGLWQRLAGLIG